MTINNPLFADVGFMSINKYGEQLCGDHIEIETPGEDAGGISKIIVLADGLGKGVKANILSTLTSKIISTMLAAGLDIGEAVETIASTLPVDKGVNTAFSTFTIMEIIENRYAKLIQYENPDLIIFRDGKSLDYRKTPMRIADKEIFYTELPLREDDLFLMMSDGVLYAGENGIYNDKWDRDHVISYVEALYDIGFTAKTLSTIVIAETEKLYGGVPTDDATVCAVSMRRRETVNVMFGPPASYDDNDRMTGLFFAKRGKHIVSGGSTAKIAAAFLGQQVIPGQMQPDPEIPPISTIDGVDLVTEGIITMNKVLYYAKNYLADNSSYETWGYKKDGASQISRMLFENATDVNLFIGKAINPAHDNLQFNFDVKMRIVEELVECLKKMGKNVSVNYF